MDDNPLELVSTAELADEILSRADHAMIIYMRESEKPDTNTYHRKFKGNAHTCIGLAVDMQSFILDSFYEDQTLLDEW